MAVREAMVDVGLLLLWISISTLRMVPVSSMSMPMAVRTAQVRLLLMRKRAVRPLPLPSPHRVRPPFWLLLFVEVALKYGAILASDQTRLYREVLNEKAKSKCQSDER